MLVVGIAGGTGSGKTTLVNKVMQQLPDNQVAIISQDAYYKDHGHLKPEKRHGIDFDHPDAIEFSLPTSHIRLLKQGRHIRQPVYSYLTCTRSGETVRIDPCEVTILEGILILTHQALLKLIDVKVYVDADGDDRLSREITHCLCPAT